MPQITLKKAYNVLIKQLKSLQKKNNADVTQKIILKIKIEEKV